MELERDAPGDGSRLRVDCTERKYEKLTAHQNTRCYVVVVDLPLLRVAVEGSDNPVSLEKPCQASLPPDQQGRDSLGRQPEVQYVLGWTQCLPQGVGAPPAMLRGRTAGFPKKLGGRASGEAG